MDKWSLIWITFGWQIRTLRTQPSNSGTGLTGGSVTLNYLGLNTDQGKVYKPVNISGTTAFNSANPANAGTLLEDGGNYFKFTSKFWGSPGDNAALTGGPASAGDLVFHGGSFYVAGAGSI